MTTNVTLISPTSSAYKSATSSTEVGGPSRTPINPTNGATTKKPNTVPPTYMSKPTTKPPTEEPTLPLNTTKLLDNSNSKKGPPVTGTDASSTALQDGSLSSKYVAGGVMALILAIMVFAAVGMSLYYHKKQRRQRQESPATASDSTEPALLSRSESVQTNARLFITDRRYEGEEGVSRGCSEPPPSYHSLAVVDLPPPAYDSLSHLRSTVTATVLNTSVETVV